LLPFPSFSVILEQISLNDVHHNLVGSFQNLVHSEVSQESLNGVVLKVAIAAVHLQTVVHNVEALVRRKLLSHGTVHRVLGVLLSDQPSPMSHHHATSFKIGCHLGKLKLKVLICSNRLAKLLPRLDIVGCTFDAGSSAAD